MKRRFFTLALSIVFALNVTGVSYIAFADKGKTKLPKSALSKVIKNENSHSKRLVKLPRTAKSTTPAGIQLSKKVRTTTPGAIQSSIKARITTPGAIQVVDKTTLQRQLDFAKEQLVKATTERTQLEKQLADELAKAKTLTTNNNSTQLSGTLTLTDTIIYHNKVELSKLDKAQQKLKDYTTKVNTSLQNRINTLTAELQKNLAALDIKIAAATTDTEKSSLTTQKANLEKSTKQKIDNITNSISKANSLLAEKEKIFEIKKASLANSDIEAKVKSAFQKKINAADSKIKKLQAQVDDLTKKIQSVQ